ncbi:hypothetical protein pdam_00009893, partial [Pocillopora damicornis]
MTGSVNRQYEAIIVSQLDTKRGFCLVPSLIVFNKVGSARNVIMPTVFLYSFKLLSMERHCDSKSLPQNATHKPSCSSFPGLARPGARYHSTVATSFTGPIRETGELWLLTSLNPMIPNASSLASIVKYATDGDAVIPFPPACIDQDMKHMGSLESTKDAFLGTLQTSQVLHISMNTQLTYEPIVLQHFPPDGKIFSQGICLLT